MNLARWTACAVAMALAAFPFAAAATAQPPEVWITLGQKEAAHLQESLERAGRPDVLQVEADGEIVVARIREAASRCCPASSTTSCTAAAASRRTPRARRPSRRSRASCRSSLPCALVDYTIDNGPVVQALMAGVQEANVRGTITSLAAFFTRYHTTQTGQDSANWIRNQWAGYASGRPDVTVQLFAHPTATTPQPSVILTIPGTTLPSEVVVLGAHQDSIADGGATGRAPGADDDASGVASLSEVIRVAIANGYRPQRTVKFMAYAAEEVGLRGSAEIAAQHRSANVNVVGVLQLDMTNYKGSPASTSRSSPTSRTRRRTRSSGSSSTRYLGLPRANTQCGYGCSDHASWNTQGYSGVVPVRGAASPATTRPSTPRTTRWRRAATTRTTR